LIQRHLAEVPNRQSNHLSPKVGAFTNCAEKRDSPVKITCKRSLELFLDICPLSMNSNTNKDCVLLFGIRMQRRIEKGLPDGWPQLVENMDKTEALRSIHHDQLEYIQRKVRVDFDNSRRQPVGFFYSGSFHPIEEILCRFRMIADQPVNGYLVRAPDRSVFCLYSQLDNISRRFFVEPGFWVLSFRVQDDRELMKLYLEDRKMLANTTLKKVVDFHGHICPELAVGGKFCEFAQNLFNEGTIPTTGFSILCENTTSALDAIQILLGATVGNQRLLVMDYGKHNYTLFSRSGNCGWKLKMKPLHFGDEEVYQPLEKKIADNEALFDEVIQFQQLLDTRVRRILALTPEELFAVEETAAQTGPPEAAAVYLTCAVCGEQVLASRTIESRNMTLCMPCFQTMTPGCSHFGIQ